MGRLQGMGQGNDVLLNGTSSAGKSTIAKALQEIMETPYLHGIYDLELDTATAKPTACAERIKQTLQNGHPRHAVRELSAAFVE